MLRTQLIWTINTSRAIDRLSHGRQRRIKGNVGRRCKGDHDVGHFFLLLLLLLQGHVCKNIQRTVWWTMGIVCVTFQGRRRCQQAQQFNWTKHALKGTTCGISYRACHGWQIVEQIERRIIGVACRQGRRGRRGRRGKWIKWKFIAHIQSVLITCFRACFRACSLACSTAFFLFVGRLGIDFRGFCFRCTMMATGVSGSFNGSQCCFGIWKIIHVNVCELTATAGGFG